MIKTAVPPIINAKTEQEILADVYAKVRRFTQKQLQALQNVDLHLKPVINGKTFNSVYWIAAHLAWQKIIFCFVPSPVNLQELNGCMITGKLPNPKMPHIFLLLMKF